MSTVLQAGETTRVCHVMTRRIHTLKPDDSLAAATDLFRREHFHHAVVVDHGRVFGVLSDRDLLKSISPFVGNPKLERSQDANTLKKRVHQIMTRKPVTIGSERPVPEAAVLMLGQRVSCLPVVNDDGELMGIVTMRDLVSLLIDQPVLQELAPPEIDEKIQMHPVTPD